ncbi:MAG TPA: transporter, partial [Flavipsychrobacter sp.]|nr:transporter [Flavipsychrobacter sp.]
KILGAGGIQAEAGAYIVNFKSGPSALVGDFSFHYGLFKQVNLVAVVQEGRERVRFMSETSQGFFPLALGTKVAVLRETQHCPAVSMSAYIQLPFNARTESEAIHWSKAFNLIAEKELFNKKWNVLANIGLQQPSNGRRYQLQTVEVVSYHGFEKVAFMAEHFAAYDPKDRPQNNLGIGLSYFLTYNLQLDISGSSTIGSAMANKCLSTGLAVRL